MSSIASGVLPAVHTAVESDTVGNPWINISIFVAFVLVTLVVVIRASKSTATAADYYAAQAPRPAALPKYIPAEPIAVTTSDGRTVSLPRRRRTRGPRRLRGCAARPDAARRGRSPRRGCG